jgi:hypothetical protein
MKEIIIKKIENRKNNFIAYFKHEFLKSTFFVCFSDSILGSVALNDFFQMLKNRYDKENFNFVISDEEIKFKNEHLLNQIIETKEETKHDVR